MEQTAGSADLAPIVIGLPTADRQRSFHFYATALGLEPIGDLAEDGFPEPLQFVLNDGARLDAHSDGRIWLDNQQQSHCEPRHQRVPTYHGRSRPGWRRGTFREPLRLTDRRARAANRQENRPTFTGWSGYPTHLVVCDRDGMTVRAADHRDNTATSPL